MNLKHLLLLAGFAALGSGFSSSAQDETPTNVLLNKAVIEVSGKPAADNEGPEKLIDGDLTTKYCIIRSSPVVVIDAQGYFSFSSFKFHDCQTNEQEENASAYKLELSMDGKNWAVAAEADNVADVPLKEITLAAPVKARYVKFSPTYNNCARMWELEGFGEEATTLSAAAVTESLSLTVDELSKIEIAFTIKGEKAEDFKCEVAVSKNILEYGDPAETDGVFSIPVKALKKGKADVTVSITNNGELCQVVVPVEIKSAGGEVATDAVTISNWNRDFVVGRISDVKNTTGFSSKSFYTSNVQVEGALCDENGIIETISGELYQTPVEGQDALLLIADGEDKNSYELTFSEPVQTENVKMLAASYAGTYYTDPVYLEVTLKYADGTTDEPKSFTLQPWNVSDQGENPVAVEVGTITRSAFSGSKVDSKYDNKIVELAIPADKDKKVSAIDFKATSDYEAGEGAAILAVNAKKHNPSSGIANIGDENAEKRVTGYYNIQGQRVQNPVGGLYIVGYSDGTFAKIYVK